MFGCAAQYVWRKSNIKLWPKQIRRSIEECLNCREHVQRTRKDQSDWQQTSAHHNQLVLDVIVRQKVLPNLAAVVGEGCNRLANGGALQKCLYDLVFSAPTRFLAEWEHYFNRPLPFSLKILCFISRVESIDSITKQGVAKGAQWFYSLINPSKISEVASGLFETLLLNDHQPSCSNG